MTGRPAKLEPLLNKNRDVDVALPSSRRLSAGPRSQEGTFPANTSTRRGPSSPKNKKNPIFTHVEPGQDTVIRRLPAEQRQRACYVPTRKQMRLLCSIRQSMASSRPRRRWSRPWCSTPRPSSSSLTPLSCLYSHLIHGKASGNFAKREGPRRKHQGLQGLY